MMLAGLFVKMSNGATYSVVPFVNKRALGAVAGIVGAGGNVGAVLAGVPLQDIQPDLAAGVADLGRVGDALSPRSSFWSASRKRMNDRRGKRWKPGSPRIWLPWARWQETDHANICCLLFAFALAPVVSLGPGYVP